ncbi:MAG: transposase, partial [Candidatus Kerfeldbacteria bacterium]|nr:transposase [Candidatus Kerfeldbacteria bacterium]
VMPDHIHGIIVIPDEPLWCSRPGPVAAGLNPRLRGVVCVRGTMVRQHPLTEIIRGFKTFSAAAVNRLQKTPGASFWQRSFHEHVLRTERDIENTREYIRLNPVRGS